MKDFIPKAISNEKINTTIRLDIKTLEVLEQIATKINISRNELISQCIHYAIDNLNIEDIEKEKQSV